MSIAEQLSNKIRFINLTGHDITIVDDGGELVKRIPPSGTVARVRGKPKKVANIGGVDIVSVEYGNVENLPEPRLGVVYITSTKVAQRVRRPDVLSPDTGPTAIRNSKGAVLAIRRLQSTVLN